MKKKFTPYQKAALLFTLLLAAASVFCLLWILSGRGIFPPSQKGSQDRLIAEVYQNGQLLQSIALSDLEESYTFTVTGENGAVNEIEVRPGSIGILSASCPDKLCVHQGFISNSLLPITCLPNRLVIQIRREAENEITPDIVTY